MYTYVEVGLLENLNCERSLAGLTSANICFNII